MIALFIKGLIIGFAIAAPVGPIGVLCIQRSLQEGFKIGFMTGLGAAFADGCYGAIAGFGLTSISSLLISHQLWIRIIGGLFLIYLGIKQFFKIAQNDSKNNVDVSALQAFTTTFMLTLTNPATILSFIAVFAGLGLGTINASYLHAIFLVLGIILGSAAWWLILSTSVAKILHHRLSQIVIKRINQVSGIIILLFGFYSMTSILI